VCEAIVKFFYLSRILSRLLFVHIEQQRNQVNIVLFRHIAHKGESA